MIKMLESVIMPKLLHANTGKALQNTTLLALQSRSMHFDTHMKSMHIFTMINTLKSRQNGHHVSEDILNAFSWMKMY